jgi:hypothetical protein
MSGDDTSDRGGVRQARSAPNEEPPFNRFRQNNGAFNTILIESRRTV